MRAFCEVAPEPFPHLQTIVNELSPIRAPMPNMLQHTQVDMAYNDVGFLICDLSRLLSSSIDRQLRPFHITFAQWRALSLAYMHEDEGVSQKFLAEALRIGKVALGGLIDRLEQNGYVSRRANPSDRRINYITLTPRGKALLRRVPDVRKFANSAIMQGVQQARQRQLLLTLNSLKASLENAHR